MEAMVEEGREEANEEEDEDEAEEFGGAEEDEDEEEDEDDLLGTRGEAGGDDLTSSSIATLQRTEDVRGIVQQSFYQFLIMIDFWHDLFRKGIILIIFISFFFVVLSAEGREPTGDCVAHCD